MTVYLERPPWGPFLEFLAKIWDFSEFFSNFSQSFEKILKRSQSLSQKLTKIEIKSNFIYIKIIFSQSFGEKGFPDLKRALRPQTLKPLVPGFWDLRPSFEIWEPIFDPSIWKGSTKDNSCCLSWTFSDSLDLEGLKSQTETLGSRIWDLKLQPKTPNLWILGAPASLDPGFEILSPFSGSFCRNRDPEKLSQTEASRKDSLRAPATEAFPKSIWSLQTLEPFWAQRLQKSRLI